MLLQHKQLEVKKRNNIEIAVQTNRFLPNMPLRFCIGGETLLVFSDFLKQKCFEIANLQLISVFCFNLLILVLSNHYNHF